MAVDSGLRVGPQDFDGAGALAADLGTHNKAHRIIMQVAAMYPPELTAAHVRVPDPERSEALDEEEVVEVAEDEGLIPEGGKLVEGSPRVRGRTDGERVVVFLVETENGRTGRAMIPYSDLRRSARAYEEAETEQSGLGGLVVDEDAADAVKAAQEDAKSARAYADELEAKLQEAEAEGKEPIPGYADLNADQVKDEVTVEQWGRRGVQAALEYEQANAGRKGVKEHLEKQLAAGE